MQSFAIARYRFSFRITESLRLPDYAGSALRGVLGHALMQLSGISTADIKHRTAFFLQSPYALIFERDNQHNVAGSNIRGIKNLPVPYIIEAPLAPARLYAVGEELAFDMVLTGSALNELSLITLAWRRAFLRGVGNGDGKAELIKVEHCLPDGYIATVYRADKPAIAQHDTVLVLPEFSKPQDVHLQLQTPLRLQQRGKIAGPHEITASIFLRNLIRRITFQVQQHNPQTYPLDVIHRLNVLADQVLDERRLSWKELERYSSRQKQKMKLSGVIGHWYLHQVPAELLPFVYLGQWLHLGKETAFGLGKYCWLDEVWLPEKQQLSPAVLRAADLR